ncbi:MAG: DUF192 domain-containing protein [Alphaproteobacteria bacterium]|nr:DUF192 domain-containing protein [Alphaproteobacteria bacterium]
MSQKSGFVMAAVIVAALCVAGGWQRLHADEAALARGNLVITHANGKGVSYNVEIAATMAEQTYGLMKRPSLPALTGMIFPYNPPRVVAFWMKDTLIPLDMLFVGADGKITRIAVNARPGDLTPVPSGGPVAAVIEIKGGEAAREGIVAGDSVNLPDFVPVGKTQPM